MARSCARRGLHVSVAYGLLVVVHALGTTLKQRGFTATSSVECWGLQRSCSLRVLLSCAI